MDVREAVKTAKTYVADLFAEEGLSDLGLEEVSLDEQTEQWLVTVGFARPWEKDKAATGFEKILQGGMFPRRSYKIVRISDKTKEVISVRNRDV